MLIVRFESEHAAVTAAEHTMNAGLAHMGAAEHPSAWVAFDAAATLYEAADAAGIIDGRWLARHCRDKAAEARAAWRASHLAPPAPCACASWRPACGC